MSKKECKRVPSYAIRHLIQSLKEKGRTCRKGAEQRIDREILICDPEEEYVRRLAEALLLKKEVTAGVRMPCAEDVYAMAKIAQYQHMLKVLRYQELESRTMYINMGKNMRQTVKETVELLKESTEKRFFYAEGRTTS